MAIIYLFALAIFTVSGVELYHFWDSHRCRLHTAQVEECVSKGHPYDECAFIYLPEACQDLIPPPFEKEDQSSSD